MRAGGISTSTASIYWAELDQAMAWPSARRARPRGVRSRDRQRAARCRRGAELAIPRSGERRERSAAPRAWRSRAWRCSRDGAFSMWPAPSVAGRCDRCWRTSPEAKLARGFQVSDDNPLSGSTGAPICCAGSAATVMASAGDFRPRRHAAAGRAVRSSRRAAPRAGGSPRRPSCRSCCTHLGPIWPSRLTLGGVAARRLLAASGADDGRRDQRPGAAAQAVAMAGLFADRAAARGRHRGDRHRRPHRPRRIPQRRAVRRHRRAARCAIRAATQREHDVDSDAGRRMARADRGAARPAGRRWCARGWTWIAETLAARARCWKAAPGRPAATIAAQRRAGRRAAASRSSATARCFEIEGSSHGRRHGRRSSAGAAQADADPRQGALDQVLPRAAAARSACCCATRSRATCRSNEVEIETPLARMKAPKIAGKKLVFAPILRAGLALVEGMLDLVPAARVAHIGLYRDPETLGRGRILSSRRRPISPSASSSSCRPCWPPPTPRSPRSTG